MVKGSSIPAREQAENSFLAGIEEPFTVHLVSGLRFQTHDPSMLHASELQLCACDAHWTFSTWKGIDSAVSRRAEYLEYGRAAST